MPYRSGSDGGDLYEESEDLTVKEITRGTLYFKDPLVILIFKSCFILVRHNGCIKIRS